MHFGRLVDWVEELAALTFRAARLLLAVDLRRCSAEKAPLLIWLRHDSRLKARSSQASTGISKLFRVVLRLSLKRRLGRPTLNFYSASSPNRSKLGIRWSFMRRICPAHLACTFSKRVCRLGMLARERTSLSGFVTVILIFVSLRRQVVWKWFRCLACLLQSVQDSQT